MVQEFKKRNRLQISASGGDFQQPEVALMIYGKNLFKFVYSSNCALSKTYILYPQKR